MAILDGVPKNEQDMKEVMTFAVQVMDMMVDRSKMSPGERKIADMMREGLSMADISGITKEERDAVLLLGCRHLRIGDYAKAQEVLTTLTMIEPTDERALYALAATFQAQGKYEVAGRIYIQFLALDATNPEGYLRLGECFLSNGEMDAARGCLEAAKIQVERGFGSPEMIAHADKMIAVTTRSGAAAA